MANISLLNLFCLLSLISSVTSVSANWDYSQSESGPDSWHHKFPLCRGKQQSPINIDTGHAKVDHFLASFNRGNFYRKFSTVVIKNVGTTVRFEPQTNVSVIDDIHILPSRFSLYHLHMHWASSSRDKGSEHAINHVRYFGEIHFVYYNQNYETISNAMEKKDGLAVLAVFLDAQDTEDIAAFNEILRWMSEVSNKYDSVKLSLNDLFSIHSILPSNLAPYYRYQGSLTTPPCHESVTWTVFEEPLIISTQQANKLANSVFKDSKSSPGFKIHNNFRPLQLPYGRKVYKHATYQRPQSKSPKGRHDNL